MRARLAALPAVVLVAALPLTGCGTDPGDRTSATQRLTEGLPAATGSPTTPATLRPSVASAAASDAPFGPEGPDSSDTPDPALSGKPLPTVPPGDPGATDDGGRQGNRPGQPGAVPAEALLDAGTVGSVAGGTWTASRPRGDWCADPRPVGSVASRSVLLAAASSRLLQSVSAHPDRAAAVRSVAATASRLAACGFTGDRDPRLGDASAQLVRSTPDGDQVALVVAADGVGVVLLASGAAAAQGTWESLADLALGSSCAAASDGCH